MKQTITTKRLSPTDTRGTRIKATSSSGISITVPWDFALGTDKNHIKAIKALKSKLDWKGSMVYGGTNTGVVGVFTA